jgi:hypothetical protein
MNQIYLKKLFQILVILIIILFFGITPTCCRAGFKETTIGGFSTGQATENLKRLGMPTPIDTGGWHTFVNIKENVIFRVLSDRKSGKWTILRIMLVDKSVFPAARLFEEHQMITGVSLASFSTGKELKLGVSEDKVRKIYGAPDKTIKTTIGEEWLYSGDPELSVGFQNNRVVFFGLNKK